MLAQRWLIAWEALLTFATTVASGIGLIGVLSPRAAAFLVLLIQGLNAGTIVFKTGQWTPPQAVAHPPVTVNVAAPQSGHRPIG